MKQRARIIVPVLIILGGLAWLFTRDPGMNGAAIDASGTVEATEADLGFQIPGRVAEVRVQEGDRVRPGDTLAVLDLTDPLAALRSSEAMLEASMAQLRELEAGARAQEIAGAEAAARAAREGVDDARRELERARRLHDGGAVSRQSLERAATAFEVAQARAQQADEQLALVVEGPRQERIEAQRAAVAQATAAVARADANLDHGVIRATVPGLVAIRHREPGESVNPGFPVLTIRDMSDRWVRIFVAGDRVGQVRIGGSADIRSDSHPDEVFRGEVFFIGSEAEFTPRNVQTTEERVRLVYPVKVRVVGDEEESLKPGTPADVTLNSGSGS